MNLAPLQATQDRTDGIGDPDTPRHWLDMPVKARRALILVLNLATICVLFAAMLALFAQTGITWAEWIMLGAFLLTLPWLSIGVWNSIVGFLLDRRCGAQAPAKMTPALDRIDGDERITARVAVVMPLRNEDPDASIARLRRLEREVAYSPWAARFSFHILSDTDNASIALKEEARVAAWRAEHPQAAIHYRRRSENTGFKAGNIADFLHSAEGECDFFLPLDADSEMSAETVFRLVRVMQASPEIGMLQSLVTGLPSRSFFTRAFQFGMRHGMRSYTLGAAWWQADCGPNWGHNILIRTEPFRAHCMLPVLPGRGPLSGPILSHDQVEAVLMRRAGYDVRVLAEESDSHEENPPSLVDFIRRELRWMNGNLQYVRLLGLPDLKPVSRIQLVLAILMYVSAPAWIIFILTGAGIATGIGQPSVATGGVADAPGPYSLVAGVALFVLLITLSLFPKLLGLAQILTSRARSATYGGRLRVVLGGSAEIVLSMLIAPIVALALTRFAIGLCFGQRIGWTAQQRNRDRLHWDEAARVLWPQTLTGLALCVLLGTIAPWALMFGAPVIVAMLGAIPIAVISTLPALSHWSIECGLFDIPEDRHVDQPETVERRATTA